ncbi:uncharacterized protein LOC143364515 [Halictus rubicundus]|uniref:uncharacterized protein LOC143364515 n=1 Tax=Halictus rubicundus TaxID=77578 RepID=UPI004034FD1A
MTDPRNNSSGSTGRETTSAIVTTMRIPPFWPEKVALWFNHLESQFLIGGITKDEVKFGYVVSQLDLKYSEEVEDIICKPPAEDKYEQIKTALIKRLSDSDGTRVRKLLEAEEIGDRTPTQFWRHIKKLAGTSVNDEFLTEIWKNRLPVWTQQVLAATKETSGDALAAIADKVHEIQPGRNKVATVSEHEGNNADMKMLLAKMQEMQMQINALSRGRDRERKKFFPRRQRSSSRSSIREKMKTDKWLCKYHFKFGKDAHRCIKPCNWQEN